MPNILFFHIKTLHIQTNKSMLDYLGCALMALPLGRSGWAAKSEDKQEYSNFDLYFYYTLREVW
jgi:hypothetical protein